MFRSIKQGRHRVIYPPPYTKGTTEFSDFEEFRKKVYLSLAGECQEGKFTIHRSEVGIEFVQFVDFKNVDNPLTGVTERKVRLNLKEAAVYYGDNVDETL